MRLSKLSFLLLVVAPVTLIKAVNDFSCNIFEDNCPTRSNGVCESETNSACSGKDCVDCDQCKQFKYDCQGCISNGCFFCPGDATCYNSPDYIFSNVFTHCSSSSDFVTDSCEAPGQDNFFSDPLYTGNKWIYDLINVLPVWESGITGQGIRVRVNDDGVDVTHPEFVGHYDASASCDNVMPTTSFHGTAVASIVLAGENNNECSVGIAPDATLSVCNVFDGRSVAFLGEQVEQYDISQNSFGVPACDKDRRALQEGEEHRDLQACPFTYNDPNNGWPCDGCDFGADPKSAECVSSISFHCQNYYELEVSACLQFLELYVPGGECNYPALSQLAQDSLATGILSGRGGKGTIYVFASGNSFTFGEDTNLKGFTNSRFIISAGAVGKDGLHSSYSTPGASLFVVGPGGDQENLSNVITANAGGGCHDAGVGTSFASPVVSGVIALMLQANPDLTWRDVQGILAKTSRFVATDPSDTTRKTNAAGFTHSNLYGFGIVDANAAVDAAKTWGLFGTELMLVGESGPLNAPLIDNANAPVISSVTITSDTTTFVAESVEIYIALQHFSRGDLEIVLTSPQGTESNIHPGQRPENTVLAEDDRWKLLTLRAWGESPVGEWSMSVRDISTGDAFECADLPWLVLAGDIELTCDYIEDDLHYCTDGFVTSDNVSSGQAGFLLTATDNGKTLAQACCACGGGIDTNEFEDSLTEWRLVVHGREVLATAAPSPGPITATPTIAPTKLPTSPPTRVPTVAPSPGPITTTPTIAPTKLPTSAPTRVPTVAPSPGPLTATPTIAPTRLPTSAPTRVPTVAPSTSVSGAPTGVPTTSTTTTAPSSNPSALPTVNPSNMDGTALPTVVISSTVVPTGTATVSSTPTDSPSTLATTPQPTLVPTSLAPVVTSTSSPTGLPTTAVSSSPTAVPTTAQSNTNPAPFAPSPDPIPPNFNNQPTFSTLMFRMSNLMNVIPYLPRYIRGRNRGGLVNQAVSNTSSRQSRNNHRGKKGKKRRL